MSSPTPAPDTSDRRAAAAAARRYLDGELTYREFTELGFVDSSDLDIEMMCDLMAHEPMRRGFLAVSDADYLAYRAQVMEFVERLEAC